MRTRSAKPTDPDLSGELNRVNQVQDNKKGAFETAPFFTKQNVIHRNSRNGYFIMLLAIWLLIFRLGN
jgi:hypothetical protein